MTGEPGALPDLVSPMQPSAGTGQPPVGPDWVVELAWTGHRCIAYVEPGRRTRLLSSGDVSMSAAYPEIGPELERRSPPRGMVLDGILVARGEEHAPRARLLHRRSARFRPSQEHIRAVPVDFQVADLLWLDGHSTVELPYRDRRALLEGLGFDAAPIWTTSPMPVSELPGLLRIAEAKGVDALHARHLGSRYRPGQRSPLWVRVPVPRTGRVLIGGWTATDPGRPDRVASLLVGVPDPDGPGLRYVGRVGVTGEQRGQVTGLRELRREDSPFGEGGGGVPPGITRDAIWVEPRVAGLVGYTGLARDGRLRLPHWHGIAEAGSGHAWAGLVEPPPPPADDPTPPRPAPNPPGRSPSPNPPGEFTISPSELAVSPGELAVSPDGLVSPDESTSPGATTDPPGEMANSVREMVNSPGGGAGGGVERRRLEQHFVYNSLNTIASLIRTDPGRARELLVGFADLTRAADQGGSSTLGRELDAVADYLSLEQARFGARLQVELSVEPTVRGLPVEPLQLLAAVRDAVQRDIEPRPQGGLLTITAAPTAGGGVVTVRGGAGEPAVLVLNDVNLPG